jgi:hypothetical protein
MFRPSSPVELYTTKRANCCKLTDVLARLTRRLTTRASALAVALGLLGSAVAPGASAETPQASAAPPSASVPPPAANTAPPSAEAAADARLNEAKRKFDEGVRAFGERRYADAAQAFREADAIQPSAALSFNIARAYERLEDVPAALRWYRDYLRRSPQATNRASVEQQVAALARRLEARGVQQISVLAKPEGALVTIDDRAEGVAPFTIEVPPGKHHLSVRASGYRAQELDFLVDANAPRDVAVSLEQLAPGAPSPSNAHAEPTRTSSLPATPVRAAARKPAFGVAPWIVLGAGAASSLGALGFELARRSAESDAEARILGVTGGVLLLGGATLLFLNLTREPSRSVALGCTSGGCSVAASGTFE